MQLKMDLGESVKDIADKTGFSESTVRRRVKLMRYDRDEMMKVQVRQPTMEQYLKLSEIEDEDAANYALRFIGTKNFDAEVEKALKRQKEKNQRDELRAFVRTKAECISDGSYDNIQKLGVVCVESLYAPLTETNKKTLEDALLKYGKLYYVESYNFNIYRKKTEADKDVRAEAEKERERHQALEYQADWIYYCMMGRADDFIKNYTPRKNDISILFAGFFEAKVWQRFSSNNSMPAAIELGYTVPEGRNSWESEIVCEAAEYVIKKYAETPEKVLLVYLRKTLNLQRLYSFYFRAENITCTPQISRVYKLYFEILEKLGYCVSDEEWEFINGTHPIYSKKANDITDEEIISYREEFADEDEK
jgi:ParB family chromosome partitioning protein